MKFDHHFGVTANVNAPAEQVFNFADDPAHLASHMNKKSWMMGNGMMEMTVDDAGGKAVGSVISLAGKAFGIRMSLEEAVTERVPPLRKVWETLSEPHILVVGSYRMGFEVSDADSGSSFRVFIDYTRPTKGVGRIIGWLLGKWYAKWCTQRMLKDTVKHFAASTAVPAR